MRKINIKNFFHFAEQKFGKSINYSVNSIHFRIFHLTIISVFVQRENFSEFFAIKISNLISVVFLLGVVHKGRTGVENFKQNPT